MTLLVPVTLLAILVLAWIVCLAFGFRSAPNLSSDFLHRDSQRTSNRFIATDVGYAPSGQPFDQTEHVRIRLSASKSTAASLSGTALHLELRPALHNYGSAMGRNSAPFAS